MEITNEEEEVMLIQMQLLPVLSWELNSDMMPYLKSIRRA
jgi:hypothetical protein